jgi:hypothetical protein
LSEREHDRLRTRVKKLTVLSIIDGVIIVVP